MKSRVTGYLELVPLWLGWAFVLIASWVRAPLEGSPYSGMTFLLVVCCIAAVSAPLIGLGRFELKGRGDACRASPLVEWAGKNQLKTVCIVVACYVAFDVALTYAHSGLAGYDVSERRQLRGEDVGASRFASRLMWLNAMFATAGAFLVGRAVTRGGMHILFIAASLAHIIASHGVTGAREYAYPSLVYAVSFVLYRVKSLWERRWIVAAAASVLALFVAVASAALALVAERGGAESQLARLVAQRGHVLLAGIGMASMSDGFASFIGYIDEYLLVPVYYLDFYLTEIEHDIAWGTHNFDTLAGKMGLSEGEAIKIDVDNQYIVLSREHNVWATGIREVGIDSGKSGILPAFLVLGGIGACLKRMANSSDGAAFLYAILVAWLWASPLCSIQKGIMIEMGGCFGLLWVATNAIGFGRAHTVQSFA